MAHIIPTEFPLFTEHQTSPLSNRNLITPTYPNGAHVNRNFFEFLRDRREQDPRCYKTTK